MFYNPMQSRLDQLNQQKQMIEQQMQMLQNYQMPPININNQITPGQQNCQQTNYDFVCKWVADDAEASNLPVDVIGFYKNEPIFTMGGKKFRFEEIENKQQSEHDDKYSKLEKRIDELSVTINKLAMNYQSQNTNIKHNEQKKENRKVVN